MLPTLVFGRYGEWNAYVSFSMVSVTVLAYLLVVALIAPIWLVRTASRPQRQHAAAIPVSIAIASIVILNVINSIAVSQQTVYPLSLLGLVLNNWNQVILAVGLALAVALSLPAETGQPDSASPGLAPATD